MLSKLVRGQDIVFDILYPLIVGALPLVLGVFVAGALGCVTGAIKGGISAIGGALGRALGRGREGTGKASGAGAVTTTETAPAVVKLRAPTAPIALARIGRFPKSETARNRGMSTSPVACSNMRGARSLRVRRSL